MSILVPKLNLTSVANFPERIVVILAQLTNPVSLSKTLLFLIRSVAKS
jgi:hypothetical protein